VSTNEGREEQVTKRESVWLVERKWGRVMAWTPDPTRAPMRCGEARSVVKTYTNKYGWKLRAVRYVPATLRAKARGGKGKVKRGNPRM